MNKSVSVVMASASLTDPVIVRSPVGADINATYKNVPANSSMAHSSNDSHGMTEMELETEVMTKFVLYGILGNMLVMLGWFGNTLSIVVLCNRRMKSSTSYYLTSLAVYDNFILLSMLLFFNLPALGEKLPSVSTLSNRSIILVPMGYPLSLAAQMGSIYTCVAFTVERFIAVCRPLHAANTCTKSRAKKAIFVIFLWSLIYNIPRCFHYVITTQWRNETQAYETQVELTEFGRNEIFQHVYLIYFQLIFMFLVPFLIISVLNTSLFKAINRARQERQQMSTTATREHNLTVMLVAVIVVFLVCQFPTIIDNILVAIVGQDRHNVVIEYQLFYAVCTFLVTINSSLNFVLYCLFGKKFRMVLCHILGLQSASRTECQYRSNIYQSRTNGLHLSQCNTCDMELSQV